MVFQFGIIKKKYNKIRYREGKIMFNRHIYIYGFPCKIPHKSFEIEHSFA